jgi:hypothetical protein
MHPPLSRLSAVVLLCFSLGSAIQAQVPGAEVASAITPPSSDIADITVGGRLVKIPVPQGYMRADGIHTVWDKAITAMLPESNRMLATYGTPEDVELLRKGTPADFSSNFNVQTVKSIESMEIGERTFTGMRAEVKKGIDGMRSKLDAEMKKLASQGNQKFEKDFGVDMALSISDTTVLGYFEETDISIGFTMAMKTGVAAEAGREESRSVVACLMTPVNGRLLSLYATVGYKGEADQKKAEASVKAWRDAILAINPKVEGPKIESGMEKIARSAGMGAGIGLVYGLIVWISKKMKRRKEAKSVS